MKTYSTENHNPLPALYILRSRYLSAVSTHLHQSITTDGELLSDLLSNIAADEITLYHAAGDCIRRMGSDATPFVPNRGAVYEALLQSAGEMLCECIAAKRENARLLEYTAAITGGDVRNILRDIAVCEAEHIERLFDMFRKIIMD